MSIHRDAIYRCRLCKSHILNDLRSSHIKSKHGAWNFADPAVVSGLFDLVYFNQHKNKR